MTEDTHTHRQTILDWPPERVEAFIKHLQEDRLRRRREIEHAQGLAKLIQSDKERDKAEKALEAMVKSFATVEKALNKITDKWSYIRMIAVQEGIDIYATKEVGDASKDGT